MFHAFELRFVIMLLVVLSQVTLSLLTVANIIVAQLSGSYVMLPIFVVATNAPLCLALFVLMVLDSRQKSPLNIQNEIILCAAAGGADLISAVAMLFFKEGDAICGPRPSSDMWNTCGASVAVMALLWTSTFLLFAYAIGLFCAARRYDKLHPLAEKSVWKQTVKGTPWSRESYSAANPPGRRLRKKIPLDMESLRRVVKDKDSQPLPREKGYASTSSFSSTAPSRPIVRPPGLEPAPSPSGFAERMGYFRRDAYGEYIASTPTRSREFLPPNPSRSPPKEVEGGVVFAMQNQQTPRRPSFPDLPNPFPPPPPTGNIGALPSPRRLATPPTPRSRSSSNSSGGSGNLTDSGFAGIGAGPVPQKESLRISIPRPLMPPRGPSAGPPSARSARTPTSAMLLGGGQGRPFRVSAPTTPTSAHSVALPRMSFQAPRTTSSPISSQQLRQAGARPGYNYAHQHARSHPSLAVTVSTVTALEDAHDSNPLASRHNRPRAHSASGAEQPTQPRPAFLQIPQPAMSPSTRQRISNAAYPLPLPSLSTYPIKSVAMSVGHSTQPVQAQQPESVPEETSASNQDLPRSRPLSTVSTVSFYSTSSASHGPPPPREPLPAAILSVLGAESTGTKHRPSSAPLRRLSKSKKEPTAVRVASQHGAMPQNRWGGTGNGPARRSLAAQFQQPRAAR